MFIDKSFVVLGALSALVVKKIQVLKQVYDFVHSLWYDCDQSIHLVLNQKNIWLVNERCRQLPVAGCYASCLGDLQTSTDSAGNEQAKINNIK